MNDRIARKPEGIKMKMKENWQNIAASEMHG
jgi:hypothetical protein